MRRTQVVLIDDLDGTSGPEADVQPYVLAVNGRTYELDLSAANRAQLDAQLQPYVAAGRQIKRQRKPRQQ